MRFHVAVLCVAAVFIAGCSKPSATVTNETAPASFKVDFETSRGQVIVEVTRSLAPIGVDRLYNLVKAKYFDDARFFRVMPGFVVQFGMAADPAITAAWDQNIQDDPVLTSNKRGTVTFATAGPNTRTTQLFINLGNNERLDAQHFSPFGKVVSGMDNVDAIYAGDGQNPSQDSIKAQGNAYLTKEFPHLDYIKTATIVQ